jgi:hypothetical protein
MDEELAMIIEADARTDIVAELGSMNVFYDRLGFLVESQSGGRASIVESTGDSSYGANARGGEAISVITAVSGMIVTLTPVIVTWIRSRSFEVEEKIETRKTGTSVRTIRVRRGLPR